MQGPPSFFELFSSLVAKDKEFQLMTTNFLLLYVKKMKMKACKILAFGNLPFLYELRYIICIYQNEEWKTSK